MDTNLISAYRAFREMPSNTNLKLVHDQINRYEGTQKVIQEHQPMNITLVNLEVPKDTQEELDTFLRQQERQQGQQGRRHQES